MNVEELSIEALADALSAVEPFEEYDQVYIGDDDRAVIARAAAILRTIGAIGSNTEGLADFIVETRATVTYANRARDEALAQVEEFKRREYAVRQRNDYLMEENSKLRHTNAQLYNAYQLPEALFEALRDYFGRPEV
jgi:hypothetical protein